MREKEEELIHLHEDREVYRATLAVVTAWLQQADQQLQQRIVSIPQARLAHQVSQCVCVCVCVYVCVCVCVCL